MQNRRHLLLSAGATLALAGCATAADAPPPAAPVSSAPAPPPAPDAAKQLSALLDQIFEEALDDDPELVTQLGLDTGARSQAKFKLMDNSIAGIERQRARNNDQLRRLKAIDRTALSGMPAVNYDSVIFGAETSAETTRLVQYGDAGPGRPYAVSQLTGSYQSVPDFLGSQHKLESAEDADAYLARLEAFAVSLDQETERSRRDAGLGVVPPDFVIERSLTQMNGLVTTPAASPLVTQLQTKLKAKGLTGGQGSQAAAIYADKVRPALQRQIAWFKELQPKAVHDAGVWRLPKGDAYYEVSLRQSTTTRLTPDEIHQIGWDQAKQLSDRADQILKAQGLTKGTVGERIQAMYRDKRYWYPNTDAGKIKLIEDLNQIVAATYKRLPEAFDTLPKAPLEIKRVPQFIEAGAPGGYYNQPTLDGSRPGIYWINLRDTAEYPRWALPTITYHEGVPGHHLQLALQQEADLPMIRRATFLSAYGEGWALYSEELAREMGVYADNPLGELGMLQAALFRSARLVVDTGIHFKRWSREKAIETMSSIDGSPKSAATTEIERYCVWPGQACSYMVGKLEWLRLREKAKTALGPRFDIRKFHDAGLLIGAVPLTVLESAVDAYVAGAKA